MASNQEQRPQRPRTSSMLSFGNRSHKSSGSVTKIDTVESPKEKASHRITGKADPSVAINELQPSVRALEQSTMSPLRSMQHRDSFGNVINDPDRSNPTRPRMERPLDTIRSFEAAIDSGYETRRRSVQPDMQSRRSSYYQGAGAPPRTPMSAGGYFDRSNGSRPASIYNDMNDRGYPQGDRGYQQERGYAQNERGYYHENNYHKQQRRYPPRNQSDPMMYGSQNVFGSNGANDHMSPRTPMTPAHGQWTHPSLATGSHETATTSSGSYGTDQGTNSTEASLHNSSYGELPHQQYKPQAPPHDAYAQGYGQGHPEMMEDEYGQPIRARNGGLPPLSTDMAPPPPPAHGRAAVNGGNTLRKAAPQQSNGPPVPQHASHYGEASAPSRPATEKRKSWLARRFSKNG